MKPHFHIEDYKRRDYLMVCESQEQADVFTEYLDSVGKRWITGALYSRGNEWDDTTGIIGYFFNEGTYTSFPYDYDTKNMLKFDDFSWGNDEDGTDFADEFADIDTFLL